MPFSLVSTSTPRGATARRIVACVALVALGYLAARVVPATTESPFVAAFASGAAAKDSPADGVRGRAFSSPGLIMQPGRDFDYLPDHYINQAREVAEQPPTF